MSMSQLSTWPAHAQAAGATHRSRPVAVSKANPAGTESHSKSGGTEGDGLLIHNFKS